MILVGFQQLSFAIISTPINYPSFRMLNGILRSLRRGRIGDDFRRMHASLFALLRSINPYIYSAIARCEVTLSDVDCYQWMRDDARRWHTLSWYIVHHFAREFYLSTCAARVYHRCAGKMPTDAPQRCNLAWRTEAFLSFEYNFPFPSSSCLRHPRYAFSIQ